MKTWTAIIKSDVLTDLVDNNTGRHITSLCSGDVSLEDHLQQMQKWEKVSDTSSEGVRTIVHRQVSSMT